VVSGVFLMEAFPHRDIKQTSGQTRKIAPSFLSHLFYLPCG
jgi:hypothetical protein